VEQRFISAARFSDKSRALFRLVPEGIIKDLSHM
jgi:hypothetical protein